MEIANPLRKQKELRLRTFLIALGVATAFFLPFMIMDQGYFLFYGDFNVQQVPFYQMCHDKIRSGQFLWDWNTDLGVNFIGSYSFYLLGSPFFWLTIPFASWMVPYLMGPLLILKFACSALTAYCFLRRFTKTANAAMLGGLLYAFSGFSVYNIFFNHFHEAIVFFPLLLLAVELFIAENRRGPLIFATFICAVSNYFFFFGMAVFCVIYWFVRMLAGRWHMTLGRLLWFIFEILIGVGLAALVLLPAFYSVMQNDRINSMLYGWNAILYGKNQIPLNIIQTFFFPPDSPARPIFFTGADVKWASLGGWLPVFGMTAVIAWLQCKKGNWLRRVIIILAIMALVPALNSIFYAFNSAYYARWFYMAVLMMSLATVLTMEDKTVDWNRGFKWAAVITVLFTLVIGLYPAGVDGNGEITGFGLFTDSTKEGSSYFFKFWGSCAIALASLAIVKYIIHVGKKSYKQMMNTATVAVAIVSIIYAAVFIGVGKSYSYSTENIVIPQLVEGEVDLPDREDNAYRIDVYDGIDNTGMYLGYPCIQAFHSIVPASVTNFYEYCGVDRGVGSRPEVKFEALRPLLSVKYLLNRKSGNSFSDDSGNTKMSGWEYYGEQCDYRIYKNENYIPYGFTYDYYMTQEDCDSYEEEDRSAMMLKAILLSGEQIAKHKDILDYIGDDYNLNKTENSSGKSSSQKKQISFTDNQMAADSAARAKNACTEFVGNASGFTAVTNLDRENLVFFSVPYEENAWTAYVDGVETEIEMVNVGFMAVRVAAGRHNIEFRYQTPGLSAGIKISIVSGVAIIIYLAAVFFLRRRKPEKWTVEYPEGKELAAELDKDADLIEEYSEKPEPDDADSVEDLLTTAFGGDESADAETPEGQESQESGDTAELSGDNAVETPRRERNRGFIRKAEKQDDSSEAHLLDKLLSDEPEDEVKSDDSTITGGFVIRTDDEE